MYFRFICSLFKDFNNWMLKDLTIIMSILQLPELYFSSSEKTVASGKFSSTILKQITLFSTIFNHYVMLCSSLNLPGAFVNTGTS